MLGTATYTVGGGTDLLVFDCDLTITVYARLDLDEKGAQDYFLTDTVLGILKTVNQVIDSLNLFDPVDVNNVYLLACPMMVAAQVDKPTKCKEPGWGRVPIRFTFSYQFLHCA